MAIAAARNERVYILLSNGAGGFAVSSFFADAIRFNIRRGLASADFDGDGNADLAVPIEVAGDSLVFFGDGTGGFPVQATAPTGGVEAVSGRGDRFRPGRRARPAAGDAVRHGDRA